MDYSGCTFLTQAKTWDEVNSEDFIEDDVAEPKDMWHDGRVKDKIRYAFPDVSDTQLKQLATLCAAFLSGCCTTISFSYAMSTLGINMTDKKGNKILTGADWGLGELKSNPYSELAIKNIEKEWESIPSAARVFVCAVLGKADTKSILEAPFISVWVAAQEFNEGYNKANKSKEHPALQDSSKMMGSKAPREASADELLAWINKHYKKVGLGYPEIQFAERRPYAFMAGWGFLGLVFGRTAAEGIKTVTRYIKNTDPNVKIGNIYQISYPAKPQVWLHPLAEAELVKIYPYPLSENLELLARSVMAYCLNKDLESSTSELESILMAGILAHTSGKGLNIIIAMAEIRKRIGCEMYDILELAPRKYINDSLKNKIWDFLIKYIARSEKVRAEDGKEPFICHSWKWARALDSTVWRFLSESALNLFSALLNFTNIKENPDVLNKVIYKKIEDRFLEISGDSFLFRMHLEERVAGKTENIEKAMKTANAVLACRGFAYYKKHSVDIEKSQRKAFD